QVIGEANRLPKAAHVFAARRAGADMGEFGILVGDIAMEISAKSRFQEPGFGSHSSPPFNDRHDNRIFTAKPPRTRSKTFQTLNGDDKKNARAGRRLGYRQSFEE